LIYDHAFFLNFLKDYCISGLTRAFFGIEDWSKSFHGCGLDLTFIFVELFDILKDRNSLGASQMVFGSVEAVKAVLKRPGGYEVDKYWDRANSGAKN